MEDIFSVSLAELVEEFQFTVEFAATDYQKIRLTVQDLARPGIQMMGYFDHFDARRIEIMGNVEMSYLATLSEDAQRDVMDRLFALKFPALLITRDIQPPVACVEMAKKHDVTLLRSKEATSTVISNIITYLRSALAPRITRHGVLMEVYGEGILLTGESGMGKSETAIELMKRGHRLIADDAVEIRKISGNTLIGTAPAVIRNFVELRGIGIINVAQLFGMGAVKEQNQIDLVVNIEPWNNYTAYDRLGVEVQYTEILGVKVPLNTIPVTPGRNLAVILEVAAMHNRQRKMGFNAALDFTEQFNNGL